MDALDLSLSAREQFKQALIARRAPIDKILSRMREQHWYTNDPAYQCLVAAQAALHAAISHIGSLPPTVRERQPVTHHDGAYPNPKMPT